MGIGQARRSCLFTIARAAKIGATKIRPLCDYCATIFQSGEIAAARAASHKILASPLDEGFAL